MQGDESYAGARSYYRLKDAIEDIMGFPMFIPTHQGRAAEGTLFSVMVKPGDVVPSNRHFDTTMGNLLELKARPVDLVVPEAADTSLDVPFKGNMDLKKLEEFIQQTGMKELALVAMTDRTACFYQLAIEVKREPGKVSFKSPYGTVLAATRQLGMHNLTEKELHDIWTKPRFEQQAAVMGVNVEVSDWRDDGWVTLSIAPEKVASR